MKKKMNIEFDFNQNQIRSKIVVGKPNTKLKVKQAKLKRKNILAKDREVPTNKYGLQTGCIKCNKLVSMKVYKPQNGNKGMYFTQKQSIVGTNGYKVSFKAKELETGMLTRAKNVAKKHYEKRSNFYKTLFFLANLGVFVAILFQQQMTKGVISFKDLFGAGSDIKYLLFALLAFMAVMFLEALRTHILIFRSTRYRKPILSYKSASINYYYELIMPLAYFTGGKTFEVFYLNNRGIKPSIATSVPLAKYVFNLIASVVVSTVVIIFKWSFLQETSFLLLTLGVVMLAANFFIVVGMVVFASSKKLAPKIVYNILKFAQKLGIVKDYRENFTKFMRFILEYQKSIQYYVKTKYVAIISTICSFLITLTKSLIPFLIYCVFKNPTPELMLDLMSKYYIVQITINFIPLPGGLGVAELTFASIFAEYFVDGTLFWAVLLWRFFSHYLFLIQGFSIIVYDYLVSRRKGIKKFTDKKALRTVSYDKLLANQAKKAG